MAGAKYHHRIPQTYLRAWGENVWFYDKETGVNEPRNIDSIMGQQFFHSIKAGSLFHTSKSLDKLFGCLDGFMVHFEEDGQVIPLDTKELLNQYWFDFDNWVISDTSGNKLTKKQRNIIKTSISQIADNTIEEEWSSKFESEWSDVISQIYAGLQAIHEKKDVALTTAAFEAIIRYYVMFLWRSYTGFEEARNTYDWLVGAVPELRDLDTENPVHREDKTVGDEMWHEFLLSSYYKFLHGTGIMQKQYESYKDHLTVIAMLDPTESLITSDVPCFEYIREDGLKEPIFIALPGLLISLAKKDPDQPRSYRIIELSNDEVGEYNRIVFDYGKKIISKSEIDILAFSDEDDIPELTTEQADYIRSQQEKAITIVSDPEDPHYEPDEEKRLTAARKLMREWEHAREKK